MELDTYLLLKQISEGESHQAFEKLYRIYFRKSFSFAMYFLKSKELAEEVVSDVFLSFWHNKSLLTKINDWNSYLYISIRNQSLLYLSQINTNKQESLDSFIVEICVEEDNPEKQLLKRELTAMIQTAVNQLPERCNMVYHMIREDGLNYKQVAEILDISERTVNTQITIAIKKISAAIKPYLNLKTSQKRA